MDVHERVAQTYLANHPDEAARELERANPQHAAGVLAAVAPLVGAEVYRTMGPSPAAACAAALGDEPLAAMVAVLPSAAAVAALRHLEPARRESVLNELDGEVGDRLRTRLSYPEDTVGAMADPLALTVASDLTVAEAQRQLRSSRTRLLHCMYVVTRDRTLVGTLALSDLMAARPHDTLATVMGRDVVRLEATAELAVVAGHPAWLEYDALPVVDGAGRMIGVLRHRTIRRMGWQSERHVVATLVGLSELYWAGLSGILASLAPAQRADEEGARVS